MAKPVKRSTAEETAQFYDQQHQAHAASSENTAKPSRPDPELSVGVRKSMGENPPYISILLALMITSTTLVTFANTASASDDHRGSGRVSYTPPVEGGPSRTGGSGTR